MSDKIFQFYFLAIVSASDYVGQNHKHSVVKNTLITLANGDIKSEFQNVSLNICMTI